jgi:hypothetical protein
MTSEVKLLLVCCILLGAAFWFDTGSFWIGLLDGFGMFVMMLACGHALMWAERRGKK